MKRTILIIAGLMLFAQIASAQIGSSGSRRPSGKTGDPRVKAVLDELNITYEVDSDGDYKITLPTSGGRTQLAFINSNTEKLGDLEIREIWAPAFKSDGPFPATVANRMLSNSFQMKLGGWQTMLMQNGQVYLAVFAAKVAAEIDSETLRTTIKSVIETADTMEKSVTGKDDY